MEIVSTPLNKVVSWTYPSQFCWFLKQIGSCNNKIPCRGIQHNFFIPKNRDPQLKQAVSSTRKINQAASFRETKSSNCCVEVFFGDKFCPSLPCGKIPAHFTPVAPREDHVLLMRSRPSRPQSWTILTAYQIIIQKQWNLSLTVLLFLYIWLIKKQIHIL